MSFTIGHPVLLFDGVCNLCNGWVNFIIDRDPDARILFAPLQSEAGRTLLVQHHLDPETMNTVVFIEYGKVYTRSDAVLRMLCYLRGWVRLLYVGRIIPGFIRDAVYDGIARKRYRWFGKRERCRMPEPGIAKRFLEMSDQV